MPDVMARSLLFQSVGVLLALGLALSTNISARANTTPPIHPRAVAPAPGASAATFPRNVIILIGDGMGYFHVDAANLYQYGATGQQPYEQFPYQFGMSTYAAGGSYDPQLAWTTFDYVKSGATDSAAAATAMASGHKTYSGAIGIAGDGATPLQNIFERAEAQGKRTGVVSSVQLSHATPAGFVAHNTSRYNYAEIAQEMIQDSAVDVIMGAGHPEYDNHSTLVATPSYNYVGSESLWQELRNGTAGGDADGDGDPDAWTLIETQVQFQQLITATQPLSRVIGVPRVRTTLQYGRAGDASAAPFVEPFTPGIPSLEEMTRGALHILADDPDGFVLMVEGGAIDWAGHANRTGRMIEEMHDFNNTVAAVVDWVDTHSSWDETLVVVTSDHETGYLTGPGSGPASGPEGTPTWNPLVNAGVGTLPGLQWNSGGHTNSLIPLYARGGAARFLAYYATSQDPVRGPFLDNTAIAHMLVALEPASDLPTAQFSQAHITVEEYQPTAAIRVTLDSASDTFATLAYTTSDDTASAGTDYSASSGVLTFAPGVISQTITISLTDDLLDEADETLVVTLSDASNAILTGTISTTLTIRDDDELPLTATELPSTPPIEGPGPSAQRWYYIPVMLH